MPIRTAAAILTLLCAVPAAAFAQAAPSVGTIVVAHGGGPAWDAQVQAVAELVNTGGPVEVSFLMGPGASTHRFQDAARRLAERGAGEIVVVPLLVSSHSGHYQQIRYLAGETDSLDAEMHHHLHMAGIERPSVRVPIRVTRAIDDSPEAARVLAERALALAAAPGEQALFLIGHGPNSAEDYAEWMRNLRPVADSVRALTGFRDVRIGLLRDDAPAEVRAEAVRGAREIIELQHRLTGRPVVVVPVLISRGRISVEKIPADLAALPIAYQGDALLPHPGMARWIEKRVSAPR
ncbi:MAG TPA: CbiX/SirB N-terminal domain-containing protein [Longimicrobium sp.]|nr:CbiX/SirB N-terminal domain-containing protein [Longimicrobium sp.]